jgi:hypothetical protein
MSRLIRLDRTGHTTLAEWTTEDPAAYAEARRAFAAELERGYFGVLTDAGGRAEQITELPQDAPTVILRLPIAGG